MGGSTEVRSNLLQLRQIEADPAIHSDWAIKCVSANLHISTAYQKSCMICPAFIRLLSHTVACPAPKKRQCFDALNCNYLTLWLNSYVSRISVFTTGPDSTEFVDANAWNMSHAVPKVLYSLLRLARRSKSYIKVKNLTQIFAASLLSSHLHYGQRTRIQQKVQGKSVYSQWRILEIGKSAAHYYSTAWRVTEARINTK